MSLYRRNANTEKGELTLKNIASNEFSEFALFSEDENRALDQRSVEREVRGKPADYVTCLVRDKDVQLKPEERTRQLWLARLIDQYGYPASRIQVEYLKWSS